ncbi:MAG: hypothetical protein Q7R57_03850 [Dehalococcoidales bacterium]|nr:hypothetical protein [Dehalococcoidales bacterium]
MLRKFSLRGLWICTLLVLLIAAGQGLSGHWVLFYLLWPGGSGVGQAFMLAMVKLGIYHIAAGFTVGILSILILIFAFLAKSNFYVRILAVVSFIITFVAVLGGYWYVTSGFTDRWALGQMADAFVGVFAGYFIQLIFMLVKPGSLRKRATAD